MARFKRENDLHFTNNLSAQDHQFMLTEAVKLLQKALQLMVDEGVTNTGSPSLKRTGELSRLLDVTHAYVESALHAAQKAELLRMAAAGEPKPEPGTVLGDAMLAFTTK